MPKLNPFTYLVLLVLIIPSFAVDMPNPAQGGQGGSKFPFKAGDALLINTFPDTSSFLNRVFPIDGSGSIELPIKGKVNVLRMSQTDLQKYIEDNFKSYLRYPNVYVKPLVRISFLGGFQRPGLYYVDYDASLWEAVRRTGGPISEEGIYDMEWDRNGKTKLDDLEGMFESGVSLKMMGFRSGDQIWTPIESRRFLEVVLQDIMPLVTFATTLVMTYYTYQLSIINAQNQARR